MNLTTLKDTPPWEWPEGTAATLLGILRDDRASTSDLLLAAELAGDVAVINTELVDVLLSLLHRGDTPEAVRGQAAISLGPVLEDVDTGSFDDADDLPIPERSFRQIQESLHELYRDANVPQDVRRRILEASVRAPQGWHRDAIRAAYGTRDEAWRLTAVFCMRFVRGFDEEILEALASPNPDIQYEAVIAAGNWGVDAAWPPIAVLVTSRKTPKPLLLAAIEAAAGIRPHEALELLDDLADSDDEDIADAVREAMANAEGQSGDHDELDDDDDSRSRSG
jgi:HEAT repeats